MRQINEVIIHCSATQPEWMKDQPFKAKVEEIRRWHKARKWSDIGYHYLIDRDGTIMAGRPVERVGAHVRGHNEDTIGVCLIGGHGSSADDDFSENFTVAQDKALQSFLAELKRRHRGIARVTGHNRYAAKACPGFDVPTWSRNSVQKPSRFWAAIQQIINAIFKKGN